MQFEDLEVTVGVHLDKLDLDELEVWPTREDRVCLRLATNVNVHGSREDVKKMLLKFLELI